MLSCKIVTPDGVVYEDVTALQVTIPTTNGYITVLPGHIPLITPLKAGELVVRKKDHDVAMAVAGGIVEVKKGNEVNILADTAERAEHIDVDRAQVAKRRAEELLSQQEKVADVDYARLQSVIERELARISVGKKYKNVK